jgi:hypothetical protein
LISRRYDFVQCSLMLHGAGVEDQDVVGTAQVLGCSVVRDVRDTARKED